MISHLQMITVYVRDMARAVQFYTEKLGFVVRSTYHDEENYFTWVSPGPAKDAPYHTWFGLFETTADDPRIGTTTAGLVLTAANVEETYHELKAAGVTITLDLFRHTYGDQETRFVDPDGNEWVLHS